MNKFIQILQNSIICYTENIRKISGNVGRLSACSKVMSTDFIFSENTFEYILKGSSDAHFTQVNMIL